MSTDAFVEVFCQAPSHSSRRAIVHTFLFEAEYDEWRDVSYGTVSPTEAARSSVTHRDRVARRYRPRGEIAERIAGAELAAVGPDRERILEDAVEHPGTYRSYRLRCGLCGLAASATWPHLQPILDTLRHAGVHYISLAALAARLRSK